VGTYRIGQLAKRTGLSAPTLRYYEEIGLLQASARSPTGYRLYDSAAEARLQFISRAKRLGLSLDEVRDLVTIWSGGQCSATRAQLRHVVAHKISEVRSKIEEHATFERQLQAVYEKLRQGPDRNGCGDDCGCVPELPHVERPMLDDELHLIATNSCTCGGDCAASGCDCGCGCCNGNTVFGNRDGRDIRGR
jgi:DNA-binding transcriptional MerR regulator